MIKNMRFNFKKQVQLLSVICAGIVLRFLFLGNASLWFDEAASYLVASSRISQIIPIIDLVEIKPPLFFLLLHFLIKIHSSIVFMRMLPACMGVITIVLFYRVAKDFLGDKYLIALFIGCFSPFWIHESQNLRMYSMVLAAVLASTILFKKNLSEKYVTVNTVWLVVLNTIGIYTHYFFCFFYAAEILSFFLIKRKITKQHGMLFMPMIFFLPWLKYAVSGFEKSIITGGYHPLSFINIIRVIGECFVDWNFVTGRFVGLTIVIGLIIIIFFVGGLRSYYKDGSVENSIIIACNVLIPVLAMFIIFFIR